MSNSDDKHSDHDLKAYLDGRDGVSAAYRRTAHDEPPAALDRLILAAARKEPTPSAASWYSPRKPYALAASVMVAVVALSLYVGGLDEVVLQPQAVLPQPGEAGTDELRVERATVEQQPAEADAAAPPAAAAAATDTPATDVADTEAFRARELAPAVPSVGAGATAPAPAPARDDSSEAFARRLDAPAVVIDGPLLQQIEADAEAAQAQRIATAAKVTPPQAQGAAAQLEEIMVTGSRILRRDDTPYRASREDWLVAMRGMVMELQRSARLTVAQRNTATLEGELEAEIELFLEQYPGTDIDAELGLEP